VDVLFSPLGLVALLDKGNELECLDGLRPAWLSCVNSTARQFFSSSAQHSCIWCGFQVDDPSSTPNLLSNFLECVLSRGFLVIDIWAWIAGLISWNSRTSFFLCARAMTDLEKHFDRERKLTLWKQWKCAQSN
jgi:hypothetical protein